MKTLTCIFVALFVVLPAIAQAETVGVRSGEHDGFTRLVVQFRGQEDWAFGRVDGGFELRSGRDEVTYRLDRVFDKIGRSRVADVRDLGDGRLFLGVDCDCHGDVDELADGQVVLDMVTGPAREPGSGVDARLPPIVPAPADQIARATEEPMKMATAGDPAADQVVVSDRGGLPLTLPRLGLPAAIPQGMPERAPVRPSPLAEDAPSAEPVRRASSPAEPTAQVSLAPANDNPERAARIAKTEAALLEQVARAAAQGLLDADMSDVEERVAEAAPEPVEKPAPPATGRPQAPVTSRGHITVETSVDRAASARAPRDDETAEGEACVDPAFFDVARWGGDVEHGVDIGAYRSRIVGEFDVADGAGVTALARNYIYITFGAEAQALMRRYPDKVERPDLLYVMAEIMDEGQSAAAADLVDQMTCDGATALWAALAQPDLRPGQAVNRDAIAMAFGTLPAHLRRHLGPGLADDLLASGDRATADLVRAAVDRASSEPTSEYGMLTAQIDLDSGRIDRATATLDDVVATGDATLPDALLQRVEATLAHGGAVPNDIVVLLDSLAFQFRGTETARNMVDAGIRARASTGDFAGAFDQLEAAATGGLFPPDHAAALREALFDRLTNTTDATGFLRLSLPRLEDVAGLPGPPRHALAARLLDLGFAGPARQALADDGAMPDAADRQLLARAALLEHRPAVAIGYLAGLADASALSLRAAALDMAQDNAGAMRAHDEAGNASEMLRAAWRGGLWPDVAMLDRGPIGAAAQLMNGKPARLAAAPSSQTRLPAERPGSTGGAPGAGTEADSDGAAPGDQPPLAAAQVLIDESRATREVLNALLAEVRTPADAGASEPSPGF